MAVQISEDLNLTPADVGLAVSVYFGVTAFASVPVGRLVERYGPARSSRAAIVLSAAGMLAIALVARTFAVLVALLAAAAAANALGQLASNASLARAIAPQRHGITFGAKQSAIPLSTLIAGAAVPAVALTVGWRWAFGGMAALALVVLLAVPRDQARPAKVEGGQPTRATLALVVIGVACALGAGAANALAAFLVDSTVARGISPGLAGLTLTMGSVVCVASRLALGWFADRRATGHLAVVAILYGVGGLGFVLLGLPSTAALVIGVTLSFGLGWAWPGVVNFAVVKRHPEAPAAATSVTQTGVYAGACIGPLALGLVATHAGYSTMWPVAGGMLLLACVLVTRA